MLTPEQFQAAMDELGMSRREVAEALGVSKSTVRHWLSGRHQIPGPAARLVSLWLRREDVRPSEVRGEEIVR